MKVQSFDENVAKGCDKIKAVYKKYSAGRGRDKLGVWDDIYTLLYLNKDILHSTGNSAHYSVIT